MNAKSTAWSRSGRGTPLRFAPLLLLALHLPLLAHAPVLDEVFGLGGDGVDGPLSSYLVSSEEPVFLHRPLNRLSFWATCRLAPTCGEPIVERMSNVALLGAVAFAWPLATPLRALLIAHPLTTFATAYAVQRPVLLVLLFLGLAWRSRPRYAWLWVLAACASKEIGVLGFAMLAMRDWRRGLAGLWGGVFFACVLASIPLVPPLDAASPKGFTVLSRLAMQPYAWVTYAQAIVSPLPTHLSLERPFTGYEFALGWLLWPALVWLAYGLGSRWLAFAALSVFPESGPFLLEPVFDHRAIVPLVAVLMAAKEALPMTRLDRAALWAFAAFAAAMLVALIPTWDRMEEHGSELYPSHWRANYHAGVEAQQRFLDAREAAETGHTRMHGGPFLDDAIAYYEWAVRARPDFLPARANLGAAYWDLGLRRRGLDLTLGVAQATGPAREAACMNLSSWLSLVPVENRLRVFQALTSCKENHP